MGNVEIVNSIRQIIACYGRDVLKDDKKFCSLLTDLIPDKKRELKIIKIIFDERTGKDFLDISQKEDADEIVEQLVNERFLDHKIVVEAVSWFTDALCGNGDTDPTENKQKSGQSDKGDRNALFLLKNDWRNYRDIDLSYLNDEEDFEIEVFLYDSALENNDEITAFLGVIFTGCLYEIKGIFRSRYRSHVPTDQIDKVYDQWSPEKICLSIKAFAFDSKSFEDVTTNDLCYENDAFGGRKIQRINLNRRHLGPDNAAFLQVSAKIITPLGDSRSGMIDVTKNRYWQLSARLKKEDEVDEEDLEDENIQPYRVDVRKIFGNLSMSKEKTKKARKNVNDEKERGTSKTIWLEGKNGPISVCNVNMDKNSKNHNQSHNNLTIIVVNGKKHILKD